MIFSFVSALADIEMNLTVRCSEAAKIPRKKKKKKEEGEMLEWIEKRRGNHTGVGERGSGF